MSNPYGSGWLGQLYCRVWMAQPQIGLLISSTYNLVAITLERYAEIVHPLKHLVVVTTKRAKAVMVIVWFVGPLFLLASAVPTSLAKKTHCVMFAFPNNTAETVNFVLQFAMLFALPWVSADRTRLPSRLASSSSLHTCKVKVLDVSFIEGLSNKGQSV